MGTARALRRGTPRRVVLAGAVAALAGAPPASAATIGFEDPFCPRGSCIAKLRYAAAGGERNDVTITSVAPSSGATALVVRDASAPLAVAPSRDPYADCEALDANTVRCEAGSAIDASVALGDADDRFAGAARSVDGGAGDDILLGSDGDERLVGGGGHDTLAGGAGSDRLADGDPPGAVDADSIDGGDGPDMVSYAGRARGVRVDLRSPDSLGEPGEGDVARGVEHAEGGDGADVLIGDASRNDLFGGGGGDLLDGRSGRDTLAGGTGADRLSGGPGRDALLPVGRSGHLRDRSTDVLDCGAGPDSASGLQAIDAVMAGCELVYSGTFWDPAFRLRPLRSPRGLVLRLDSLSGSVDCVRTRCLVLRLETVRPLDGTAGPPRGALVGRASFDRPRARARPWLAAPGVRLSERGARLLRRHRALWVRVRLAVRDSGRTRRATFVMRLRAPRR
jgi:hypothetical protein